MTFVLTIPAIVVASVAIGYLLYILAVLSRKLGAVNKTKPYYRWLYVSIIIIVVTTILDWLILALDVAVSDNVFIGTVSTEWLFLIGRALPLLIAAIIAVVVVVRYWGWLFREHDR